MRSVWGTGLSVGGQSVPCSLSGIMAPVAVWIQFLMLSKSLTNINKWSVSTPLWAREISAPIYRQGNGPRDGVDETGTEPRWAESHSCTYLETGMIPEWMSIEHFLPTEAYCDLHFLWLWLERPTILVTVAMGNMLYCYISSCKLLNFMI